MRSEVAEKIDQLLPTHHERPEVNLLYRMMRDYPARGGKGLRSELLLLTAEAYGASNNPHQDDTTPYDRATWLAAALELFQTWVLIHDDIEDDSEERRGHPTLHREHGVPLAINAGDAVHAYMWAAVLHANTPGAAHEIVQMIHRTAEGQHVDLAWVNNHRWDLTPDDYLDMVRLKTARYTVTSPLRLGMLAAARNPNPHLTRAGELLGAAFQIRDDVLNLTGNAGTYGKEIAGDLLEGKRTLIVLHWLTGAPREQRETFLEHMSRPRDGKDPHVIEQIVNWLRESGAIDHATRIANEHAHEGLTVLAAALADAPQPEHARRIVHLMEQLATRDR